MKINFFQKTSILLIIVFILNIATVILSKPAFCENTIGWTKTETSQILEKKENPRDKVKNAIYEETSIILQKTTINWENIPQLEAQGLAKWLIDDIDKNWLLKDIPLKSKSIWFSIVFSIIYIAIYCLTIIKIRKTHHTVSSGSFWGFAILNAWFAISNWIFDIGSLWYLSSTIMWTITTIVNEYEKIKIKKWKVVPQMSDDFRDKTLIQQAFMNFIKKSNDPVVIYINSENSKQDKSKKKDVFIGKNYLSLNENLNDKNIENKNSLDETLNFWNPAMENITWYSFSEVEWKTQYEIMKLLYWYDETVLEYVVSSLGSLDEDQPWYKDRVFSLKRKDDRIVDVSWQTEKVSWWGRVSFGKLVD